MPQMSPLMWAPLFIIFSAIFLAAMVKTFFSVSKSIEVKSYLHTSDQKSKNWTW